MRLFRFMIFTSSTIGGSELASSMVQRLGRQAVSEKLTLIVSTAGNAEPAGHVPTAAFVFAAVIACRNVHEVAVPLSDRLETLMVAASAAATAATQQAITATERCVAPIESSYRSEPPAYKPERFGSDTGKIRLPPPGS